MVALNFKTHFQCPIEVHNFHKFLKTCYIWCLSELSKLGQSFFQQLFWVGVCEWETLDIVFCNEGTTKQGLPTSELHVPLKKIQQ